MNAQTMTGDIADQGQVVTELFTAAALANKRPEAPKEVTGRCLNCGEEVEHPRRWCDRYCASEWEKENT